MSNSKEMKVTIKGDVDPEILKWVNTLKYGAFPKVILEMLRWYDRNNLLVRGGVVSPDLLAPKVSFDQSNMEIRQIDSNAVQEILKTVLLIDQKLSSVQVQFVGQGGIAKDAGNTGSDQHLQSTIEPPSPIETESKEPALKMSSPFKVFTSSTTK